MFGKLDREHWKVTAYSQIGASHSVCQDSSMSKIIGEDEAVIAALADGHGSASCPYSGTGARIAVEVACEVLGKFYVEIVKSSETDISSVKRLAEAMFPRDIVQKWRNRIESEYQKIEPDSVEKMKDTDYIKFGTTLLCALVTPVHLLLMQLGDGDILLINEVGDISVPMQKDERMMGNDTLSLCSVNAAANFRHYYLRTDAIEKRLAMIFMSTDGFANSFESEEGYQQAGIDYYRLISSGQEEVISENMPAWLAETSREGSGDDISLAVLYRTPIALPGGDITDAPNA